MPKKDTFANIKIVDGSGNTISDPDEVRKWFEKENALLEKHGPSVIFQAYTINIFEKPKEKSQGKWLTQVKLHRDFVPRSSSVATVKAALYPKILEQLRKERATDNPVANRELTEKNMTLVFNQHAMVDSDWFYKNITVPAWVTVIFHNCSSAEFHGYLRG